MWIVHCSRKLVFLVSATGYDLNSHESDVKFRMSFSEYRVKWASLTEVVEPNNDSQV